MKNVLIFLMLFGLSFFAKSQDEKASLEKSTFGIQTGLLGIWAHVETRLSTQFVLRSELGFNGGISRGKRQIYYVMYPTITLEPRWL